MGGSGGGFFSGETKPSKIRELVAAADSEAIDEVFETRVSAAIDALLSDVNNRDAGSLQQHMDTIEQKLSSEIEGDVRILFGGSIAKHTYVDGLSDADALVILNKSELGEESPDKVRAYLGGSIDRASLRRGVHEAAARQGARSRLVARPSGTGVGDLAADAFSVAPAVSGWS